MNRAGRTGGTFLHTSRTNPSKVRQGQCAGALARTFNAEKNDLTPEVLKNLEWLGIDYMIPIGGDDTLSYGVRLYQEGMKVVAHSRRPWTTMCPAPTTASASVLA